MVSYKRLAVIPARGGSKRIPKKNILPVEGKPMIAYTIEAALGSEQFDRVMVSTDDEEIADVARQYGASVPFMRTEHADDFAGVSEVTADAVSRLKNELGETYQTVAQLMANCPLRNSEDIEEAVAFYEKHDHQFQISCFQYGWMNPWWAHQLGEDMTPRPVFEEKQRFMRSQDQPDLYCPTGAIWIAHTEALSEAKTFYGPGYKFFPLSWISAVDIDDYEDLKMLKALMKISE